MAICADFERVFTVGAGTSTSDVDTGRQGSGKLAGRAVGSWQAGQWEAGRQGSRKPGDRAVGRWETGQWEAGRQGSGKLAGRTVGSWQAGQWELSILSSLRCYFWKCSVPCRGFQHSSPPVRVCGSRSGDGLQLSLP